jgi:CubicO group peptidase (beta-lactamase class C family)
MVTVIAAGCSGAAEPTSTPGSAGPSTRADGVDTAGETIAAGIQATFDESSSGAYDNVRAVLVTVDGKPLFERYYGSSDEPNNVFSVTKSVMAMLVGMALDDGDLVSVDQTLAELLPAHADVMSRRTKAITLQQVLTMTAGLPSDADDELFTTEDWVVATLAAGPDQPPGEAFEYSNPDSHLLGGILVEATGQSVLEYAREKLFAPLEIRTQPAAEPVARSYDLPGYDDADFAWPTDPAGIHVGWCCLKLTARNMASLGQLWLDEGSRDGTQLVSADWVKASTSPHVETNDLAGASYGYQWWVTEADGHPAFAAAGYDGQLIEVVPALELVVVIAAEEGLMNVQADALMSIVSRIVAPALRG